MWITPFLPIIKWGVIALTTYFLGKKGIEAFGSTPAKRAEQLGIPRDKLYEEHKKYREDKAKYMKERNEENNKHLLDELAELKKKLEKLEKQKISQAQEASDESDPTEKNKKLAMVKDTEKEISQVKTEINRKEKQIEQNNQELAKVFDELGKTSNLTEEQLVSKSNAPDLGAWKNWGIIAVVTLIVIVVVRYVFSLLKGLFSSTQ